MSRIDEALRRAGLRSETRTSNAAAPGGLDSFPEAEPAVAETIPPAAPEAPPVPVDAALPVAARPGLDRRALVAEKLILHERTGRACIEQYRRVAAMLHQLQEERGTKVLMVAS